MADRVVVVRAVTAEVRLVADPMAGTQTFLLLLLCCGRSVGRSTVEKEEGGNAQDAGSCVLVRERTRGIGVGITFEWYFQPQPDVVAMENFTCGRLHAWECCVDLVRRARGYSHQHALCL